MRLWQTFSLVGWFLLLVALLVGCGENLDKAMLEPPKQVLLGTPTEEDDITFEATDDSDPDPAPPGGGDSSETSPPPVETSTLIDMGSGNLAAEGVYVPAAVTGLRGKMLALGAGHGWRGRTSSESPGKRLQRPWVWPGGTSVYSSAYTSPVNNWAIVEDYMNSEITHYLNMYLRNAGAETTFVREQARSRHQVVVCPGGTGYSESGPATFYSSSNDSALAAQSCTAGTKYRFVYGDGSGNSSFSYSLTVPADGVYPVYYHFRDGTDRATSIPVTITHAGGVARTTVNLAARATSDDAYGARGLRYRVAYLGEYYFKTSSPAVVTFRNQFASDRIAVADVVRLGGGIDTIPIDGSPTNEERWKSSAFQYQKFLNRPSTVARLSGGYNEDVTTRPHAANYENVDAFISVHNNATGSSHPYSSTSGKGSMIIYQYGSGSNYKPLDEISRSLGRKVLDRMVDYIRAKWDSGWTRITWGYDGFDGNYGETRVALVPAALVEIAFFTQYQDWAALSNESFYRIAARGIYHGIAEHFGVGYSPEEVEALRVTITGSNSFTLAWDAPSTGPAPTFYVVRTSTDGKAFDSGRLANTNSAMFTNVAAGQVYHFQVLAGNANGLSLGSEVVSLKMPVNPSDKKLLIVNGFDRLDNRVNFLTTYDKRAVGPQVERGNTFNFTPVYLKAVVDSGRAWSVASCSNEAVVRGHVALANYDAVIWYVGRESWADETFSHAEQVLVQNYLNSGGKFVATGSEIGWDLKAQTIGNKHANDVPFLENYLRTSYVGDDAGSSTLLAGSGVLTGVPPYSLDNGLQGSYINLFPDYYNAINGSACVQQYNVSSRCAILYYNGSYRLFSLGYPFEIIVGATNRQALMDKMLAAFE